MEDAETADFEGVPLCMVRADFLAVIALSVLCGSTRAGSESDGC